MVDVSPVVDVENVDGALSLRAWVDEVVRLVGRRVLPINLQAAEQWSTIDVRDRLPPADGLMAATALFHQLTVVTRDIKPFERASPC